MTDNNNDYIWYTCPNCNQKLFKILSGAVVTNILIYCKKCKQETQVNITPNTNK